MTAMTASNGSRALQLPLLLLTLLVTAAVAQNPSEPDSYTMAQRLRAGIGVSRDMSAAVSLLSQLSDSQARAAYDLGTIYEFNEGDIGRDVSLALRYYNQSAVAGYAPAMTAMGVHHVTGHGLPRSIPRAQTYFTFAANAGDADALLALGNLYSRYFKNGHDPATTCQYASTAYHKAAKMIVDAEEFTGMGLNPTHMRLSELFNTGRNRLEEENDMIQYLRYSADTGEVQSQVSMATLLLEGHKVHEIENDDEAARDYLTSAAAAGDASAFAHLGFLHLRGRAVPQNLKSAHEYLKLAADRGSVIAMNHLGLIHLRGIGTPVNFERAHFYFKAAADLGSADGMGFLGNIYLYGWGVTPDHAKAFGYFSTAAKAGHTLSMFQLARMHDLSLGGLKYVCPSSLSLYRRVAESGLRHHQNLLQAARLYLAGDEEGALLLYEREAALGLEVAIANTAWLYDRRARAASGPLATTAEAGDSVAHRTADSDAERAFYFYSLSAELNNAEAYVRLGDYAYYGVPAAGQAVDLERAVALYRQAADWGNPQAAFNLGYMYEWGRGLPQDLHLAKRYYDLSAERGPDAFLPRLLALAGLAGHWFRDWLLSDSPPPWPFTIPAPAPADSSMKSGAASDDASGVPEYLLFPEGPTYRILGFHWDNFLLAGLFLLLLMLFYARHLLRR